MKKTISLLLSFIISASLSAQNEELLFSPKGIAEIHITLADGKKIHDIQNEKFTDDFQGKLKGEITIKNSSTSNYASPELYKGNILIKGRGNTSWHRDKRPYNIDFVKDDWETENPARVLGMPEGDEWALLAFWNDRSLMRLPLAAYLGQYLDGMSWTPRVRYVEVWINNDYRGLYCISEKILRDDNRVDIKKLNAESTDLSGGYILEATPEDGHKSKPIEMETQFKTSRDGINFIFKYPKPKNVTQAQRLWIKEYMDEFEAVLRSDYYRDLNTGYQKYINEDSFIDWTILHEMSKGCDNLFHASVFVHKDRNGKLNMSSPWDFDLSFGNSGVYTEDENWVRTHRWFGKLWQDERYAKKYIARYEMLKPLFDKIPEILQANYEQLNTSGVLDREFDRFPQILWEYKQDGDGRTTPTSYKGHVQYLSEWIMSRNNWVYVNMGLSDSEKGERMKTLKPIIRVLAPEAKDLGNSFEVQVMKSDKSKNKYTYSWNDSPGFTSSSSRKISREGKYWVRIKDEWGNITQASDTLYFGVQPWTSIETINETVLTYNNPAKESLNIHFTASERCRIKVLMSDINGVVIKNEPIEITPGYNNFSINIADINNGIYILQIQTQWQIISRKVIIRN